MGEEYFGELFQRGIRPGERSTERYRTFMARISNWLGKKIAVMGANSFIVKPTNDLEEAFRLGAFHSHPFENMERAKFRIELQPVHEVKKVYLIPVTRIVYSGEKSKFLAEYGLKLCKMAPNYLLGLMAQFPEEKLPPIHEECLSMKITAADNDSMFVTWDGNYKSYNHLSIRRDSRGHRSLELKWIGDDMNFSDALLAEDI